MTGYTIFFLISAFIFLILTPVSIIKDIKKGKNLREIFISNIEMVVLFLVSVAVALGSFLSTDAIKDMNQLLFVMILLFIVAPLILILLFSVKSDIKKWRDPKEYKFFWVYKIRHIFIVAIIVLFVGALYKFYLIFNVVFP